MGTYILAFGAIANVIGTWPYLTGTLSGVTKPNRVTWFLWGLAPLIAGLAALSAGVGWAVVPIFVSGILSTFVFVASFINKNAYWQLGFFDYCCGFCSMLALFLWLVTKEPVLAVVLAVASDGFAALPTLIKSWKHPETESIGTYIGGFLNAAAAFFVIQHWDVASLVFPIYVVIQDGLTILFIWRGKMLK